MDQTVLSRYCHNNCLYRAQGDCHTEVLFRMAVSGLPAVLALCQKRKASSRWIHAWGPRWGPWRPSRPQRQSAGTSGPRWPSVPPAQACPQQIHQPSGAPRQLPAPDVPRPSAVEVLHHMWLTYICMRHDLSCHEHKDDACRESYVGNTILVAWRALTQHHTCMHACMSITVPAPGRLWRSHLLWHVGLHVLRLHVLRVAGVCAHHQPAAQHWPHAAHACSNSVWLGYRAIPCRIFFSSTLCRTLSLHI